MSGARLVFFANKKGAIHQQKSTQSMKIKSL